MDFIERVWPEFASLSSLVDTEPAASVERRVESTGRIWEHFAETFLGNVPQEVHEDHIIAFMLFRVASVIPNDVYAGAVKLTSFTSIELYALFKHFSKISR